jgi:hypothetical protein
MDSLLNSKSEFEEPGASKLSHQALSFFLHALLALGSWIALMLLGYALNPAGVPQLIILALSMAVPLAVGLIVARFHSDEMARLVWLLGLIWLLIFCIWVLDMPTGPNQCFQCGPSEKLIRTLFSMPRPSGLIDNDGPFLGMWPAAALMGYSLGARLGRRRQD